MTAYRTTIRRASGLIARHRVSFVLVGLSIAVLALGNAMTPGFGSPANVMLILGLAAFAGLITLGQATVMITGGIDLSVPWTMTFCAVTFCMISGGQDSGIAAGLLWLVGAAAAIGCFHAAAIELLRVSPIVVTLATNAILQGIALIATNGTPSLAPPPLFSWLAQGRIAGIPLLLLVWIAIALLLMLIYARSFFGKQLFAIGENRTAAGLVGINSFGVLAGAYALSAFLAGLAGLFYAGFSGMSYLGMGDQFLLPCIAAVAIGGISIYGGRGSVLGAVAGTVFMAVLGTFLTVANASMGLRAMVTGCVILAAVMVLPRAPGQAED